MNKIRDLHADEREAFDDLRSWLDGVRNEMREPHKRRLRIFLQDNPVNSIRVDEEYVS
jgi:hypothetical protein